MAEQKMSAAERHYIKAVDAWNDSLATGTIEEQRQAKQRLAVARRKWRKARVTVGTVAKPETLRVNKGKKG